MRSDLANLARINKEAVAVYLGNGKSVQEYHHRVTAVKDGVPLDLGIYASEGEAEEAAMKYNDEYVPGWRGLRTPGLVMGPGHEG